MVGVDSSTTFAQDILHDFFLFLFMVLSSSNYLLTPSFYFVKEY